MICPACNFGIMEKIVEGVLHCPDCNHLLKEKDLIADGREDLSGAQRRVVDNWDEFQNITPIRGWEVDDREDQEPDNYHQDFNNEDENNYNELDTEINYVIDKKTINKEYDIQKIREETIIKQDSFPVGKVPEFDKEYGKRLFEFIKIIYLKLNIRDDYYLNKIVQKAEGLYKDARNNGLIRKILHNQNLRLPEIFAVILAYYSLKLNDVSHIDGTFLKPAVIYNKVKEILEKRGVISRNIKKPQLLSGFFYDYLSSNDQEKLGALPEFKAKLRKRIPFKLSVKKNLKEIVQIFENFQDFNLTLNVILNNLFSNNLKRDNIPTSCRNPINLVRVIIFFTLQHENYSGNYKFEKVKDFLDYFPSLTKLNKTCFHTILPIAYQFLSPKILKKINYLPQDLSIVNLTVLEHNIWKHFDQMLSILKLSYHNLLKNVAVNLHNHILTRGFSYSEFPSQKIQNLTIALLFLSIQASEEHSKLSRNTLINQLSNKGYRISEHQLNPILKYLQNIIDYDEFNLEFNFKRKINSSFFESELLRISLEHNSFNRTQASNFTELVLALFKISKLDPQDFAKKLNIYSSDPSQILMRIENNNILTRVDVFLMMVESIEQFIITYIPKEHKEKLKSHLSKVIDCFEELKKLTKHKAYLRVKKRRDQYGDNYKSTIKRIKRFIIMLGFSPYDGYDFMKEKYRDNHNKVRLNGQYHHMDYNPSNDNEENHIFLPSKHPKDMGKRINYMIHEYISGLEAILKDERKSSEEKEKAQKELEIILQRNKINTSIISQAFYTKNELLLDDLIGWNKNSINKIKIRLNDLDLKWTSRLNEYIPKEKYGEKISTQEFNKLLKELREN